MTPLHRSMPDAEWAPLDSEHFVPASAALEEDIKETLNSAVHQLHLPPITDVSVACLSTPEDGREHPRCSAAHKACTELDVSATPDHTGSYKYDPATEADLTSKTSVNAGEPAAAPLAQEKGGQDLQLDECTPIPELHALTSALTQRSRPQQTFSKHVTGPKSTASPSASLLSPAAVSGSNEEDSEKPPLGEESGDLNAPCATLAAPRLQKRAQGTDEATQLSGAAVQPPTTGSNSCLSNTIAATKSEVGIQEDSNYLEKGSNSNDFYPDALAQEATQGSILLRNSGATECRSMIHHQAHLHLHPETSTSHVPSEPQLPGAQQASLLPPPRETAPDPESGLQLQQHADLVHQRKSPQVFVEQLQSPECDASISAPQRTPSERMAMKESYFNTQRARSSDISQLPTSLQSVSPEAVHPASYSLFVADGSETSGRSPTQLATATLPAEGSVTSLPCWPDSAWPVCPSLGVPSMVLPPHSLQQLHPHLQEHLLPNWQATYSLPNFYIHNDHNETETGNCSTAYGTGASTAPLWPDGVDEPKGSYSPGGLWQPLPSAYVKRGLQTSLQAGESFSCGHVTVDCSNNYSSCGRCRTQQWIPRMQSEQGYNSVLTSTQAAPLWLQEAQKETTQKPQMEQFQQCDVCSSTPGPVLREALMSSSMKGRDAQVHWKRRDPHVETDSKKINSTKGRGSSVYRRQLLQQLAVRHSQQKTRQAENLPSLVANKKVDAAEIRKKKEDPPKEQASAVSHGLCTQGEVGVTEGCANGASVSTEIDPVIEASDSLHTCVTAPADPSLSLVAAAEARESPPEEGTVNYNPQDDYDGFNATHVPGDKGCANRCTDASSTQQFVHANDLCFLGQDIQWVVPPTEAAVALAAVRAAAASAAAAIAAEWQQHLEQHYLEDWMQQLSPAHQWWLLHLQQTDQLPIRYMPFYMKDWQETEAEAYTPMPVALDAESRGIAFSATPQTTQEQRQLLQNAEEESKWRMAFNEQHFWQLQPSTFEEVMHPVSPLWTANPHGPPTPAAGTQQGAEGACWQDAPESILLREQQTGPYLRNLSRQRIHALHRFARTDRCGQRSSTLREFTQQWGSDATCPEIVASNESMLPSLPPRPLQQRQLLRVAPRSTACLSLSEDAEGMQLRATGQHNTPKRSGRRWRRAYRGPLAEDCCHGVQMCRRPDVGCPLRRPCYPTCCVDVGTSSRGRRVFHASASGFARRTPAVEFLPVSEIQEPRRLRSACGHEDFFENAPRWGKEAADLDVGVPPGMTLIRGSAVRQIEFQMQFNAKGLITRSCCFPCSRSAIRETTKRRGASLGGMPQEANTVTAKAGISSAVKSEYVIHRRHTLLGREPFECKDALKSRQTEQGAEGVSNGTELRTTDVLPTLCTSHKATSSQTALLRDKTAAHSTNRMRLTRPPVTCGCGGDCMHGCEKRTIDAIASTATLCRRSRRSERFRAAGNLSAWVSGGKCSTCQAGHRKRSCKDTFCSVTQNNGCTSNAASVCGRSSRMEIKTHTDMIGDERTAPEKWPLPRKREDAAEEGNICAPPRSHSRARLRSVGTVASPEAAEQKETDDTGNGHTRRGNRPC